MPKCGSQILFCELPIRFDTYSGCSHLCKYCFSYRKGDIKEIKVGESANELKKWIDGKRSPETSWCDWQLPLHWGGMSDPFQPIELTKKRSLEALKIFAESGYPFIVSTKNKMIAEGEYFDLITKCNCVVQFSGISPQYDKIETGASTFAERIEAARKLTKAGLRVNIRMQPYTTQVLDDIMNEIPMLADAGIYGIILEGIKYFKKVPGFIAIGGDFVYPRERLLNDFIKIKDKAHEYGLKFYSGENRLRRLGDSFNCCGSDGMPGWKTNKTNVMQALFGYEAEYSEAMKKPGSSMCFKSGFMQDSLGGKVMEKMTFEEAMELVNKDHGFIKQVIGEIL